MKTKFGTALALVTVLLTGTAAAAINTQALISPTDTTLGTAATTLLPTDQVASVEGVPNQVTTQDPTQAPLLDQPVTQESLTPTPAVTDNKSKKAKASKSSSKSSNYDDDEDDDDEDDDDEDDDDEDDD